MPSLLVLGGSLFLGRHTIAAAQARGWQVTILNRGRTGSPFTGDVERLRGDRDHDVSALSGRRFDVVIDTSAYHPRHVERVADVLSSAERYILVSTASVYRTFAMSGADESAPTHDPLWDPDATPGPAVYGQLKRACEEAAVRLYRNRTIIVRPVVLVGPLDASRRFPYWVRRVAEGGDVLAPGVPHRGIQLLDARDLAEWMVRLPSALAEDVFNVGGASLTMETMLSLCCDVAASGARLHWVPDSFLLEHHVRPWTELPLWVPADAGPQLLVDDTRARRFGFVPRPLRQSAADVLASNVEVPWALAGGLPKAEPIGRDRERALLNDWFAAGFPTSS